MDNAHERKKQPELVRRNLLDHAARLAVEQGVSALTVQAVAVAAGVTKGGLFHHFANKQALLEAMFMDVLEIFDRQIDDLIRQDEMAYGCFSRAYVNACFMDRESAHYSLWTALSVSMISEAYLRQMWTQWGSQRTMRHADTDSDVMLEITRLAADGIWLADLTHSSGRYPSPRKEVYERLIEATKGKSV